MSPESNIAKQVAIWWHEADEAVRSRRIPRARRFLRWVLASCPEDEEAWLWLARLASSQAARLAYLRQAYAFQPNSPRVQAALREARRQQLESSVGDLKHGRSLLRCLPDERHIRQPFVPSGSNRTGGSNGTGRLFLASKMQAEHNSARAPIFPPA